MNPQTSVSMFWVNIDKDDDQRSIATDTLQEHAQRAIREFRVHDRRTPLKIVDSDGTVYAEHDFMRSSRRQSSKKPRMSQKELEQQDEEVHAAIARQASKPIFELHADGHAIAQFDSIQSRETSSLEEWSRIIREQGERDQAERERRLAEEIEFINQLEKDHPGDVLARVKMLYENWRTGCLTNSDNYDKAMCKWLGINYHE